MTTSTVRYESHAGHGIGARALLVRAATAAFRTLALWQARHSQRRALAELTAEHLNDIGVSAVDAAAEVRKPFWQA